MFIYTFLGAPGAGKGSLSSLCVSGLNWVQLSTGNLCRQHIAEKTEIGQKIDFAIKSGKLVSDDLIMDMVSNQLVKFNEIKKSDIILDGCPRTVAQAEKLCGFLKSSLAGYKLKVVLLELDNNVVISRLNKRLVCENKSCQAIYSDSEKSDMNPKVANTCDKCGNKLGARKDDNLDAIVSRLEQYSKNVEPLLDYYKSENQSILKINADQKVANVFLDFKKIAGL